MYHWHVGVLTNSIEESLKAVASLPGVDMDKWSIGEVDFSVDPVHVGTAGPLRSAVGRIGTIVYEFLQPMDDLSFQAIELAKKGPGVHHTAYICEGDEEQAAAVESYLAAGGKKVWEIQHGPEHVVYVQAADDSMIVELINCCPFMPE